MLSRFFHFIFRRNFGFIIFRFSSKRFSNALISFGTMDTLKQKRTKILVLAAIASYAVYRLIRHRKSVHNLARKGERRGREFASVGTPCRSDVKLETTSLCYSVLFTIKCTGVSLVVGYGDILGVAHLGRTTLKNSEFCRVFWHEVMLIINLNCMLRQSMVFYHDNTSYDCEKLF